jgi:GST-like protein
MAIAPWLRVLDFYGAKEVLEWENYPNLQAYVARFEARPAVQVGLNTPPREG